MGTRWKSCLRSGHSTGGIGADLFAPGFEGGRECEGEGSESGEDEGDESLHVKFGFCEWLEEIDILLNLVVEIPSGSPGPKADDMPTHISPYIPIPIRYVQ